MKVWRRPSEFAHEATIQADQWEYGSGVRMLRSLGVRSTRLLSNNPRKLVAIEGYGLSVTEWPTLAIPASSSALRYLATMENMRLL